MGGLRGGPLLHPNEIYANQHHATDLLENMSVPYTAKVARVNAVVAASLALAPKSPVVMRAPAQGRGAGAATPAATAAGGTTTAAARRAPTPMISRGQSGYDALMQWRAAGPRPASRAIRL